MEEELEEMLMDREETSSIDDVEEEEYSDPAAGQIVSFVKGKYYKAETSRRLDEERWIQAYRNYRGLYGPDVQFTSTEKFFLVDKDFLSQQIQQLYQRELLRQLALKQTHK